MISSFGPMMSDNEKYSSTRMGLDRNVNILVANTASYEIRLSKVEDFKNLNFHPCKYERQLDVVFIQQLLAF